VTEIAIAERVRAASEEEKTLNRKEPSAAGAATKIRNVSRKGAKAAKKAYCHFDRREKSFFIAMCERFRGLRKFSGAPWLSKTGICSRQDAK